MLITHEAPLDMLYTTRAYTDYDYCLVHLLDESQEYEEFFLEAKKEKCKQKQSKETRKEARRGGERLQRVLFRTDRFWDETTACYH